MAIVLQSNQDLIGNDFQYITDKGLAFEMTKNLVNELKKDNLDISQVQFDALNVLEQRLIDNNLSSKVLEIYPFVGASWAALFYKMKYIRNNKLIRIHAPVEATNNDNLKGMYFPYKAFEAQCLNTNVLLSDLKDGYSAFIYASCETVTDGASLLGVGNTLASGDNAIMYRTSDNKMAFSNNTSAVTSLASQVTLNEYKNYCYSVVANEYNISSRKSYVNSAIVLKNEATALLTSNVNQYPLALGASKSTTNTSAYFGAGAKIRFSMITKTLTDVERNLMNDIIHEFCTLTEK